MSAFDRNYFERDASYGKRGGYAAVEEYVRRCYGLYFDLACATIPQLCNGTGKSAHDIGCAYGVGVRELERRGYDAYGSDISAHAIEEARRRDCKPDRYVVAPADAQSPFGRRFDLVTCIHVLEHVKDTAAVINAMASSLAPGAHLLLATPNPASISPYRRFQRDPTHINEQPPEGWASMVEQAGLRVISCKTYHIIPIIHRLTGLIYVAAPRWLGYDTVVIARRI
ncbi:MAG: class I SAM-dependent methyltransferase [Candidatus Eremiobacteraeota bacterium]|nr:class I SAM-dependent methyltransferase [Candidatus Eremiobacteraeota bacterium]